MHEFVRAGTSANVPGADQAGLPSILSLYTVESAAVNLTAHVLPKVIVGREIRSDPKRGSALTHSARSRRTAR